MNHGLAKISILASRASQYPDGFDTMSSGAGQLVETSLQGSKLRARY